MEDKYSNIDAKKYLNQVVDGITRSEQNNHDINDDGTLDGVEDDEFSFADEMGISEIEDYIVNYLWMGEVNYMQLRAVFLKLYQLRNHPNLSSAERSEIDRLIELVFTSIDPNYTKCAEKAASDAEVMASKGRK